MSLDVYLESPGVTRKNSDNIFIRRDGETVAITREEWDALYPGREPVVFEYESDEVYHANITHNLNIMANHAGLYTYLWRPDEIGITKASELIDPLKVGLEELKSKPDVYKQYNPSNGWGNYEGLVRFVENYLAACIENQDATVTVSR